MEEAKAWKMELQADADILVVKISGEATSQDIENLTETASGLVKKHKLTYVLVVSDVLKMPLSARKAAARINELPMKKMALVCRNPVTRAIATFLLIGYKTTIKTRIFSKEEDARNWFREEGE